MYCIESGDERIGKMKMEHISSNNNQVYNMPSVRKEYGNFNNEIYDKEAIIEI